MNLLIVGASRGIGARLTEQALARDHGVRVLVRRPEKMVLEDARLEVVKGDALDPRAVAEAVLGRDAVFLTLGRPPTLRPVELFSTATRNVIAAMKEHGVKRLFCVTGIGAGGSRGHGGFLYDRIVNPLLLGTIYADKERQEALVRDSGLDWEIVRPGFLTHGPCTGDYRVLTDLHGVRCGKISRADVADYLLGKLDFMRHRREAVLLTR